MLCEGIYKHIVPTGLKIPWVNAIYKHIVPTGLKRDNLNNHAPLEVFTITQTFSKIEAYGAVS